MRTALSVQELERFSSKSAGMHLQKLLGKVVLQNDEGSSLLLMLLDPGQTSGMISKKRKRGKKAMDCLGREVTRANLAKMSVQELRHKVRAISVRRQVAQNMAAKRTMLFGLSRSYEANLLLGFAGYNSSSFS